MAVGTHKGLVQIWDVTASKKIAAFTGHTARVGALAWNADLLSSGSRDRTIIQRDIKSTDSTKKLSGHRQEVRIALGVHVFFYIYLLESLG